MCLCDELNVRTYEDILRRQISYWKNVERDFNSGSYNHSDDPEKALAEMYEKTRLESFHCDQTVARATLAQSQYVNNFSYKHDSTYSKKLTNGCYGPDGAAGMFSSSSSFLSFSTN
jgi:hypothetical protein